MEAKGKCCIGIPKASPPKVWPWVCGQDQPSSTSKVKATWARPRLGTNIHHCSANGTRLQGLWFRTEKQPSNDHAVKLWLYE